MMLSILPVAMINVVLSNPVSSSEWLFAASFIISKKQLPTSHLNRFEHSQLIEANTTLTFQQRLEYLASHPSRELVLLTSDIYRA